MADNVWIIGAAMTKFGRYPDKDIVDLASDAALDAMTDADASIHDMNVLAVGSQFEMYTLGQRIQKQIGQTGIPVYNVTNACATGATAVRTVLMAIKAGEADMGLAVGVEKMGRPASWARRARPANPEAPYEPSGRYGSVMPVEGVVGTGVMAGVFAQAGMEYAAEHDGVGFEQFAKVAEKNHAHSTLNPLAQYQKVFSLEEVMGAEMQAYPNTLLMCCPTGDGAAAVVLVSDKLQTLDPDVRRRAVKISASVMATDPWVEFGQVQPDVNTVTRNAADQAYEQAGVGPEDLDLVELHDCFATAELIHYDNLRPLRAGRRRRLHRLGRAPARRAHPGQRQRRPDLQGPPARRHRRRQHLRGRHPPPGRGRRPPDRGRQGRPHPRHRARLGLRRPHPREAGRLGRPGSR